LSNLHEGSVACLKLDDNDLELSELKCIFDYWPLGLPEMKLHVIVKAPLPNLGKYMVLLT
jgi:hypothetical protein